MIHRLKQYIPSATVLCAVLYATLAPHPLPDNSLPRFEHIDKLIHAVMMGGLTAAILFDYYRADPGRHPLTPRTVWTVAVAVMLFGAADEPAQLLVGRSCDMLDLAADWVGCIVAALTAPPAIRAVVAAARKRLQQRRQH